MNEPLDWIEKQILMYPAYIVGVLLIIAFFGAFLLGVIS